MGERERVALQRDFERPRSGRLRALLAMVLPTRIARPLVNLLGHEIAPGARIGFSWVAVPSLRMAAGARIGHLNRIAGPFSLGLDQSAAIGNQNVITRARWMAGPASLLIGAGSKITSRHMVDLTCSVSIGADSIVAGCGSQVWTHGYVHEPHGRYRVDGAVTIGAYVYIGSASLVSAGVRIADSVIVGAGSSVAKDLDEAGLYVSAGLRHLPRPPHPSARADLAVSAPSGGDVVYRKRA